ncbi:MULTISPECIES: SDR family oxidoreductase [Myxococcaceae]|uniref:SDR family oxidoreductase n=1 Tax=Myxococcaceae TaxID=31 RepID=UPI00129D0BD9|nr:MULTISPECIES: NAD(P)H-binding protein [Myxococcaceae]
MPVPRPIPSPRRLAVAGSTGAVGRTLVRLAPQVQPGLALVPLVRRRSAASAPPGAALVDFQGPDAVEELARALRGATTLLQLVGTMRRRFASGDTYETSDVGTTRTLLQAAVRAGSVDHVVLLSATGAGRPVGAYLKAKAQAEALVRASGLPFTLVRPSAFEGEGHRPPPGSHLLAHLPGLRALRPIPVEALARALLHVGATRTGLGAVLEGEALWAMVRESGASPPAG